MHKAAKIMKNLPNLVCVGASLAVRRYYKLMTVASMALNRQALIVGAVNVKSDPI